VIADKVDGQMVTATPEVLAQAIRDSVDKYGACIINVSLGIKKDDPAVREAVAHVQKQGALVICAAGNDGDSKELYYPAAYDGVLTVGSHDKGLKVSGFTQRNGTVDILAPGEDIWLASRNGKTYGARGTSYATGFVSATAALFWKENLTLTPEEVAQTILSSAQTVDGWKILKTNDK
jgi:subtilisin family serine protease